MKSMPGANLITNSISNLHFTAVEQCVALRYCMTLITNLIEMFYCLVHYSVSLTNNLGETPREVAIRFANAGCIALLAPKAPPPGSGEEWLGEEAERDQPSPLSLERAKERMEKLMEALQIAKTRFRELGGELPEDREIELLKREHQR